MWQSRTANPTSFDIKILYGYQYLNGANNFLEINLICWPVTTIRPHLSEKWRCCQKGQREGMEDGVFMNSQ